ncbi:MAG: hypothetical protein QXM38_01905 [Candidatus Aenigmatarchaeota archaeon]
MGKNVGEILLLGFLFIIGVGILSGGRNYKNDQQTNRPSRTQQTCVNIVYYNPLRGGINCYPPCSTTADGTKIIEKGKLLYAWNPETATAYAACPPEYPFGTIFVVYFPDGTEGKFTCHDRGSAIKIKNGCAIIDVLHEDGIRGNVKKYNPPRTKNGHIIGSRNPYPATVYIPYNN